MTNNSANFYRKLYPDRDIYSVTRLNHEVHDLINSALPTLWIEGEISNFSKPSSGHMYFSLKDPNAQIRCAMFRGRNHNIGFTPENGMQVIAMAKPSLYEPRGDFQLIVEHMEIAGDGLLRQAFEALKQKLHKEGLFAPEHKQTIPTMPQQIGVITSATGAAVRDIVSTCRRRFPAIPIIIYPTSVQGEKAANEIVHAIELANHHNICDVLILSRGGGSLEDLWPFNEEVVARAIYTSKLPIVSGVGHEIDCTIADFVADLRAATPTAAAELVCPDQTKYLKQLQHLQSTLATKMLHKLAQLQQMVTWLRRTLRHPQQKLLEIMQQLDHLETRLTQTLSNELAKKQQHLLLLSQMLNALSPQATLERGYAIVTKVDDSTIVRDAKQVKSGDIIKTQLARGKLRSIVQ